MEAQFFGQGDWLSTLLWFIIFLIFILFGPRLMVGQTVWRLERDLQDIEAMAESTRKIILRRVGKRDRETRAALERFMDFFVVPPVNLDPYGIVKKLDHVLRNSEERFAEFSSRLLPGAGTVEIRNMKSALSSALLVHGIAKTVRHFLQLIKKYKIFQLAFLLQMQLPIIKKLASSSVKATESFLSGMPVGDSIGPMVAASFMRNPRKSEPEEFVYSVENLEGRRVIFAKADGPGACVGKPGKFIEKICRRYRISRLVTVDAAGKLEGERTGSVAEGVGIAMGGPGVDRYEIEETVSRLGIPVDAIVIKQDPQEDVIVPMKPEIYSALEDARAAVVEAVKRAPEGSTVLVLGVGNTSGVGNDSSSVDLALKKLKRIRPRSSPSSGRKRILRGIR